MQRLRQIRAVALQGLEAHGISFCFGTGAPDYIHAVNSQGHFSAILARPFECPMKYQVLDCTVCPKRAKQRLYIFDDAVEHLI